MDGKQPKRGLSEKETLEEITKLRERLDDLLEKQNKGLENIDSRRKRLRQKLMEDLSSLEGMLIKAQREKVAKRAADDLIARERSADDLMTRDFIRSGARRMSLLEETRKERNKRFKGRR